MKQFLFFLFVLGFSGCRTIEGNYYESFGEGWGGADYEFRKDGTFSYESHYDVGGEYGTGTYSMRFGRMKLKYGQTSPWKEFGGKIQVTSVSDSGEEFQRLDVFVQDEIDMPFIGCIVTVGRDSNSYLMGGATDMDGKFSFRGLSPGWDSVTVVVRCTGYKRLEQKILLEGHSTARCKLELSEEWDMRTVDSGRVEKYNVRKFTKHSFVLRKSYFRHNEPTDYQNEWSWVRIDKRLVRDTL